MEIADKALLEDLGMTLEEFEGAYAAWRVGAGVEELADSFKCSSQSLAWYFVMRGAGTHESPLFWPGVEGGRNGDC